VGQTEASALAWVDVNLDRGQFVTFRQKTRMGLAVPIFPQRRPPARKTASLAVAANGGFPPRKTQKVFYVAEAKKALTAACSRLKLPNYSGRAFSENVHCHCNRAPGQIFFTDFGESSK
jgi:hypothetical protein